MIATEQARERYQNLEVKLVHAMSAGQLLALQKACQETALQIRAGNRALLFRIGLGCLAGGLLAMCFSSLTAFITLMIGVCGTAYYMAKSPGEVYSVVFKNTDGEEFSVHDWMMKPDNPALLLRWNHIVDGDASDLQTRAVILSDRQRSALEAKDAGLGTHLFRKAVMIGGCLLATSMAIAVTKENKWILFAAGAVACWLHLEIRFNEIFKNPQRIDPNESSATKIYQKIVEALDAGGVPDMRRRAR